MIRILGVLLIYLDCVRLTIGGDVRDRTAVLKLIFCDVYMFRKVVKV